MTERFERDAWLTASMVEPGFDPFVHHVFAFVVSAPERAVLEALDAPAARNAAGPWGGSYRGRTPSCSTKARASPCPQAAA
jgi:hypothetical protein